MAETEFRSDVSGSVFRRVDDRAELERILAETGKVRQELQAKIKAQKTGEVEAVRVAELLLSPLLKKSEKQIALSTLNKEQMFRFVQLADESQNNLDDIRGDEFKKLMEEAKATAPAAIPPEMVLSAANMAALTGLFRDTGDLLQAGQRSVELQLKGIQDELRRLEKLGETIPGSTAGPILTVLAAQDTALTGIIDKISDLISEAETAATTRGDNMILDNIKDLDSFVTEVDADRKANKDIATEIAILDKYAQLYEEYLDAVKSNDPDTDTLAQLLGNTDPSDVGALVAAERADGRTRSLADILPPKAGPTGQLTPQTVKTIAESKFSLLGPGTAVDTGLPSLSTDPADIIRGNRALMKSIGQKKDNFTVHKSAVGNIIGNKGRVTSKKPLTIVEEGTGRVLFTQIDPSIGLITLLYVPYVDNTAGTLQLKGRTPTSMGITNLDKSAYVQIMRSVGLGTKRPRKRERVYDRFRDEVGFENIPEQLAIVEDRLKDRDDTVGLGLFPLGVRRGSGKPRNITFPDGTVAPLATKPRPLKQSGEGIIEDIIKPVKKVKKFLGFGHETITLDDGTVVPVAHKPNSKGAQGEGILDDLKKLLGVVRKKIGVGMDTEALVEGEGILDVIGKKLSVKEIKKLVKLIRKKVGVGIEQESGLLSVEGAGFLDDILKKLTGKELKKVVKFARKQIGLGIRDSEIFIPVEGTARDRFSPSGEGFLDDIIKKLTGKELKKVIKFARKQVGLGVDPEGLLTPASGEGLLDSILKKLTGKELKKIVKFARKQIGAGDIEEISGGGFLDEILKKITPKELKTVVKAIRKQVGFGVANPGILPPAKGTGLFPLGGGLTPLGSGVSFPQAGRSPTLPLGDDFTNPINSLSSLATTHPRILGFTPIDMQKDGKGLLKDLAKGIKKQAMKVGIDGSFGKLTIDLPELFTNLKLVATKNGKVVLDKKIDFDLIELITKRFNPKKKLSKKAIDVFRKLVKLSEIPLLSAQGSGKFKLLTETSVGRPRRVKFIDDSELRVSAESSPEEGEGIGKVIKIITDPNKLIPRLDVLIGSIAAGNTSIPLANEAMEVIDHLLKMRVLSLQQHKKLSKLILR